MSQIAQYILQSDLKSQFHWHPVFYLAPDSMAGWVPGRAWVGCTWPWGAQVLWDREMSVQTLTGQSCGWAEFRQRSFESKSRPASMTVPKSETLRSKTHQDGSKRLWKKGK